MFREGPTEAGITDHKMINPMKNEKTQQDPEGQQERTALAKQRGEVDLSVEVVLILVFGMFFVLYGLLVFPMYAGVLPYSPDSTDGLFLVLVLSLIHISEPTSRTPISYAVFCLKKKKKYKLIR